MFGPQLVEPLGKNLVVWLVGGGVSLGWALCPKTHIRLGLSVSLCRQLSDEM